MFLPFITEKLLQSLVSNINSSLMEQTTDLFGIPVPSTNPLFIGIVVFHIFISLSCVISGFVAMLSEKNNLRHASAGRLYYYGMLVSFISIVVLSIMRWPHNNHLLVIGTLACLSVFVGRRFAQTKIKTNWPRLHTILMGSSYILLLTGFYVDNGKNLPFWKLFPQIFFWFFPAAVGIPIILYVLMKHPLNRIK